MELTEKLFWEKFWNEIKLPQTVDYNFKNDRIIAETIKKYIPPVNKDKTVSEIGCAPGKWLVMFNQELGYRIAGFEYCEPAFHKTLQNLEVNGIKKEDIEIELVDFLNVSPQKKYDVVVFLGFIEHFDDIEGIFNKHHDLLNDSGYLIIGVPNFRGINFLIQKIIDKHLDQKIIPNHNLRAMDIKEINSFAQKLKLKKVFSDYVGGFEPGLFNGSVVKPWILKKTLLAAIRFCNFAFSNNNSRLSSGYILCIYKKD